MRTKLLTSITVLVMAVVVAVVLLLGPTAEERADSAVIRAADLEAVGNTV